MPVRNNYFSNYGIPMRNNYFISIFSKQVLQFNVHKNPTAPCTVVFGLWWSYLCV